MKTMYALRITRGGKSSVIRLYKEQEAREWVESFNKSNKDKGAVAKYIGKVKVSDSNPGVTNADKKKRTRRRK
jgi:hypothetical protein